MARHMEKKETEVQHLGLFDALFKDCLDYCTRTLLVS